MLKTIQNTESEKEKIFATEGKEIIREKYATHEEFIESLIKVQINKKKKKLIQLDNEITLTPSKLKKFINLEEFHSDGYGIPSEDMESLYYKVKEPFHEIFYTDYDEKLNEHTLYSTISRYSQHILDNGRRKVNYNMDSQQNCNRISANRVNYAFKNILNQVTKGVQEQISAIIESGESIDEKLNDYISEKTNFSKGFKATYISKEELYSLDDDYNKFLIDTYERRFGSKWTGEVIKIETGNEKLPVFYYPLWYSYDRKRVFTHYYNWLDRSMYVETRDLVSLIAISIIAKASFTYFNRDEYTKLNVMEEFKQHMNINREHRLMPVLNIESFTKDIEMNSYFVNPNIIAFFVVCILNMAEEELDLLELEEKINESKSTYATSYITKKNIPKATLEFMDNNRFLDIFSYVEADELCDLEKLRIIESEFVELEKILPLIKMDTYSLRFRRLGRQKTLGEYYPIYRCMCIDVRSVSRFMHEFMIMLDYNFDIISLNPKFKPLRNKAKKLITSKMKANNVSESTLKQWNSKNKYGSKYYLSNDKIFARLGEIYIREILGIKTSFNKREFNSEIDEILYSYDDELLKMIEDYFDSLFKEMEDLKSCM